jgi:hypothetical protein
MVQRTVKRSRASSIVPYEYTEQDRIDHQLFQEIITPEGPVLCNSGFYGYQANTDVPPGTGHCSLDQQPERSDDAIRVYVHGIVFTRKPPQNSLICARNEYNAVVKRQLVSTLSSVSWKPMYDWVTDNFDLLYPNWDYHVVSFEYWNKERGVFSKGRMLDHIEALADLLEIPLEFRDKFVEAFIKTEIFYKDADYDVRNISAGKKRYNSYFGPPIYSWSKSMTRSWSKSHWILYTSGCRSEDICDWIYDQCNRIGQDFDTILKIIQDESRQDSHVSEQALRWEHDMMEFMGVDIDVVFELKDCIIVIGFTSSGIMYSRVGSRRSGDHHTSSGNSNMNGIKTIRIVIDVIFDQWVGMGYTEESMLTNPPFALAVQGDDTLLLCHTDYNNCFDENDIKNRSALYGFKVKMIVISTNVYDIDYCSRHFYPTDDHPLGYMLCPKIGKVLQKIGWSRKFVHKNYNHNRGIALGLFKDTRPVPFLREWCDKILELTDGYEPIEQDYDYAIHVEGDYSSNERTWEFLSYKYDLDMLDLDLFKRQLDSVQTLPWHLDVDFVDRCAADDYQ